jgi:hypothetical protein
MTSSSITEEEILKILSSRPGSFERVKSSLWKNRKARSVKLGSKSTLSNALKGLHEKGLVEYDVASRMWKISSLGRIIAYGVATVPLSAKALTQMTQPLVSRVERDPEQLVDLLSAMFVYFSTIGGGKLPISEGSLLTQTKVRLALIGKGNAKAISAIWVDAVELLIGHFSGLMAAILLYRSSTLEQNEAQASATIHRIVEQWFRPLSVELADFLSKYLANLEDLIALEKMRAKHSGRR